MKQEHVGLSSRPEGLSATRLFAQLAAVCLFFSAWAASAGPALTFAPSPDCYVTTTGRITTTAFTVELWFRQTGFDAENQLFHQDVGSHAGRLILTTVNGTNRFHIGSNMLYGNTRIQANVWNHVAFVRTATGASTIYLNGAVDRSGTLNTQAIAPNNIVIGVLLRAKYGFRGQIADVRVWNAARTQEQIQGNKNTRLYGTEPTLVHYWPLDEGTGATTYNRASTAHGTITGATWSDFSDLPITSGTPEGAWATTTGGNWSDTANWFNQIPAQGVGAFALFTNQPPAALSITNDLADLKLGKLTVSGEAPHTFSGNALTLTNQFATSQILSTNGSHTFALPLATTANGLSVEPSAPAAFTFDNVLSGPGAVSVNPWASGGGLVTFSAANTYTGPTLLGCGTLSISSWSALGNSPTDPANLTLGPGTLRVTGTDSSTSRGMTINPGSRKAATLRIDHDLTLTGPLRAASGALLKRGPGTLTLTAASNELGRATATSITAYTPCPANGDSPANGFGALSVLDGKVILGGLGQTNVCYEEAFIGGYTTAEAGKETTAEMEITGGYTRFNSILSIGYHNGNTTTAPTPLIPRLTVSGGLLSAGGFIIGFGYDANQNTRPVADITGGTFAIDGDFRFGDQRGSATSPMLATVNVSGGALIHSHASYGMRMGGTRDAGAADATLNLFGGLVDEFAEVQMARYGSTSAIYLGGGTLRMRNITHNSTNGLSRLTLNGGVLQPRSAGYTLSGLTAATVSTNGAVIDTSLAPYTVRQDLLHDPDLGAEPDGGLVKTGAKALTLSFTNATYTGVTAVNEGELRIGGNATQTVSVAALAVAPGAAVGFTFKADGTSNDRLVVAQPPAFASGALIALTLTGTELPFTKNGTYTLLTYAGAAPAVSGLACANAAPGKTYLFTASSGALTVTLGNGGAVWNTDADGAWATAANWTTAPASGDPARFDEVITAPRTVTTAGQTAGGLYFNNASAYTLAGSGLTLSSGAAIAVEQGAHSISAPLALADTASVALSPGTALTLSDVSGGSLTAQGNGTLNLTASPALSSLALDVTALGFAGSFTVAPPVALGRIVTVSPASDASAALSGTLSGSGGLIKTGSSTLTLGTANTYTGTTTVKGGTLSVPALANGGQPSSIGSSPIDAVNLNLSGGTLRYTGPTATVNRGFTVNPGSGKAAILRLDNDLTVSGWINNSAGALIKTGPGTLRYTRANAASTIGAGQSGTMGTQGPYPANGDAPANGFGCFTIAQGKVMLGAPGQTNTFNAEVTVGAYTTSQEGQETTGELEFVGGHSVFSSSLDIGYYNGTTLTAPTPLQPTVTVSGGTVNAAGMIMAFGYNYFGSAYPNTHAVLNIAGGTLTVSGDFRFGDQIGSGMLATLNVTTGALIHTSTTVGMGSNRGGNNTLNLYGGLVDEYADLKLGANNSTSRVNLHGGILRVRTITGSTGSEYLTFNGGTLQPRTAGQTLADNLLSAVISTNGAVIDTSLASYTIAQKLTRDPALGGARDGGLVKLGTNSLSLTGTSNTFSGPLDVRAGLLRARVSSTNDLVVATHAFFDALAQRATVRDLTGSGTLTNGVIAVTGTLDAGTNSAPAGARMTVENLSFVGGSTFACDWSTNALGHVTNDFVIVTGTLAAEGPGFIDFGRSDANPLPMPFTAVILSYDAFSGSFAGWKAINTGLPEGIHAAVLITAANNLVTLDVRSGGTLILLK
jgi:autotransporter-associated beta strand protein